MTGYESKRAAARDKLEDDDTQVYQTELTKLLMESYDRGVADALEETKAALAHPAQEPVAWLCKADKNGMFGLPTADKACKDCFPVYAAPPQRPWVGLTDDAEIFAISNTMPYADRFEFARAIEAKLKERNHG
jgi:hypothetical protein